MSRTRDQITADIADQIVSGCVTGRVCLASVLEGQDVPITADEFAALVTGDREARLDLLSQFESRARVIVSVWLQTHHRGRALVAQRMDAELEDA